MTWAHEAENHGDESMKSRNRPWPVKAVGLLLFLQAVGMFGMGFFYLDTSDLADRLIETVEPNIRAVFQYVTGDAVAGIFLIQLSLLALLAVFGFWRMRRNAWMNAMLLQGLSLSLALVRYFTGAKTLGIYILMAYAVFMVLYLNHYEVRMAFRLASMPQHPAGSGPRGER